MRGAGLNGPGVPPTEPGDRVSSLPGPEYDSEDDGGRCNNQKKKKKKFNYFSGEIKIIGGGKRAPTIRRETLTLPTGRHIHRRKVSHSVFSSIKRNNQINDVYSTSLWTRRLIQSRGRVAHRSIL